jgi:hypothetical protein
VVFFGVPVGPGPCDRAMKASKSVRRTRTRRLPTRMAGSSSRLIHYLDSGVMPIGLAGNVLRPVVSCSEFA